jgi:hypothetical protein
MRKWHTSSYSDGGGGECVEVAEGPLTLVRDTRHRELGHLVFPAEAWSAFIGGVKAEPADA